MARKRSGKGPAPRPQDAAAGSKAAGSSGAAEGNAGRPFTSAGTGSRAVSSAGRASGRGPASGRLSAKAISARNQPAKARQQVIPDAVANRMARRIAIATGIPTVMGMGVFIGSYLVVSRGIIDIPPGATLVASGGCFLLGLVGLSYGVLSSSWEDAPGSLLGREQIGVNISRLRESIRAMRQGASGGTQG